VDLFRIDQARELEELGLDSAADSVLIIEWPERAGESAWPDALRLTLEFDREGARRLTASLPPAWQERWRPQ
jgi:tRNA threonylcarbamoyladenosine biosynthesis protein TsaE